MINHTGKVKERVISQNYNLQPTRSQYFKVIIFTPQFRINNQQDTHNVYSKVHQCL